MPRLPRVVSLLSSATEIVCALGYSKSLVGISHECDFPTSINSLPRCSSPRLKIDNSSKQIDDEVKSLLAKGEPLYSIDSKLIRELRPDVIITQAQCDVCAVSESDVRAIVSDELGFAPDIVTLIPNALNDIWADIFKIGAALGDVGAAEQLVESLKERLGEISRNGERALQKSGVKPRVACIEWFEPLMVAGNWVPELVKISGGEDLFGLAGKHSPYIDWGKLVEQDPDTIVLMPCGFGLQRTISEAAVLPTNENWKSLDAVKKGRVTVTDGNQFFNRPGPRVVESCEILFEIFFPKKAEIRHQGISWNFF